MTLLDDISAIHSGARFYRADLHIHSYGGSHDVADTTMTPAKIVETAVAQQLAIIAVTDHNEITNVGATNAAAQGKPIFVLPGVELTTPHGHLLVYFRDLALLTTYYGRLEIVDHGTPTSRCQTSLLDCLKFIDPANGFAILAHVDGDGGLERSIPGNPPHKSDVLTQLSLLGIELKSPTSQVSFGPTDPDADRMAVGVKRRQVLRFAPGQSLARVLFSDSHGLGALGKNASGARKLTRFKMDTPSFDGVRLALLDAEARVRLEDEVPSSVPRILGAKLEGGFLDGQVVNLSPNLTCIIGGRGAGKSTLFEAVRTLSRHPSASGLVDSEVWPDRLSLVWIDEAGTRHTIVRETGKPPTNIDDPDFGAVDFAIECYSQGDTAATSKQAKSDPTALLAYLDQFIDLEDLNRSDAELRDQLLQNQTDIEKAGLEVNKIPQYEKALSQAKQQIEALEKAKAKEVVALERKIAEERSLRAGLESLLDKLVNEFKALSSSQRLSEIRGLADPNLLKVGAEHYRRIQQLAEAVEADAKQAGSALLERVTAFSREAREQVAAWKAREREISEEIEKKRKELADQGVKLDLAYIRKVAEDEAKHQATVENLRKWKVYLGELWKARNELLKKRREVRGDISTRREAYGKIASTALQGALSDLSVSVKFAVGGFSPEGEELIQSAMGWRTVQVPRATLIAQQLTLPALLDAVHKKDASALMALKDESGSSVFNKRDADEVLIRLAEPPTIFKLERCVVEDRPRISVTKAVAAGATSKPVTREFAKLSLGQQQSVLLALMLCSDSTAPLLIDQPEDNLDSEFIYHSLVPVLRRAKERRQVIVVTHNPNITVLGDAELVVALKGLNDKGQIMTRGSIDDTATRKMACQILEGAEDAFIRRARIYGLPP